MWQQLLVSASTHNAVLRNVYIIMKVKMKMMMVVVVMMMMMMMMILL
jgi:hypothetical protein